MNIKKLFLVFVTALIAQFSFAVAASNPVSASYQTQSNNRVIDYHTLFDPGNYGLPESSTYLNGPNVRYPASIQITKSWEDNGSYNLQQMLYAVDGQIYTEYWNSDGKKWSSWTLSGGGGQKGDKGDKGDTGSQGLPGVKGETGAQGIQGVKGDVGAKGDTGTQGIQGIQGVAGKDGANGKDAINPMTTAGDLTVGGVAGAPMRLAKGAAGTFLTATTSGQAWENPLIYGNSLNSVRSLVAGQNISLKLTGSALTISTENPVTNFVRQHVQDASFFVTDDTNSPTLHRTQIWTEGTPSGSNATLPTAIPTDAGGFNVSSMYYVNIPSGSKITLKWFIKIYNILDITSATYNGYMIAGILYADGTISNMSSIAQLTTLDKTRYKSQNIVYSVTNYQQQTKDAIGIILSCNSNDIQSKTAIIGAVMDLTVKPFEVTK